MPKDTQEVALAIDANAHIVVVADSHSKPHSRAHEWIERQAPSAILHAGDIGNFKVIDELQTIAPTYAVRGNIDGRAVETPDDLVIHIDVGGTTALRVLLTHIAVGGPRLRKDARDRARIHGAQLIVCGHSHVPLIAVDGDLTVFNPGSLGPRRFHLPITFGVMDFDNGRLRLRHVDCETGDSWKPPPV